MTDRQPIAYLTGEYPAVSHTFILREVEALRALGRSVTTCAIRRTGPEHRQGAAESAAAASTFYVLEAAQNPVRLLAAQIAALRTPRRYGAALALAWRTRPPGLKALLWQMFYFLEATVLARHLQAQGIAHLHNHFGNSSGSVAMLTSVLSGIPFSYTMHGPAIFFEPHHWRIDEKIARARFVACISHFCRSQGMIFSDPVHWDKLKIIHCGVRPDRYGRTAGHAAGGAGKRIIFVGRLAAVKGVPVLLEAFARARATHPEAELVLVGDGAERPRITARAADLGLGSSVRFAGYLTQDQVADELAQADIFALPSFAEGVPVVLMEAMATGLPVIATRIAGIGELVEEGASGFLVPPGDVDTLADRLCALLADAGQRSAMGQLGRACVVEEFDIAQEAARLDRLFEGDLPEGPRPALL